MKISKKYILKHIYSDVFFYSTKMYNLFLLFQICRDYELQREYYAFGWSHRCQKTDIHEHTLSGKKSRSKNIILSWRKLISKKICWNCLNIFEDFWKLRDFTKDSLIDPIRESLVKSRIFQKSSKNIKMFPKLFFRNQFSPWKSHIFWSGIFPHQDMDRYYRFRASGGMVPRKQKS